MFDSTMRSKFMKVQTIIIASPTKNWDNINPNRIVFGLIIAMSFNERIRFGDFIRELAKQSYKESWWLPETKNNAHNDGFLL